MPLRIPSVAACAAGFLLAASPASAQLFDESYDHWPEDLAISGKVVVGTGLDERLLGAFLPEAGSGRKAALFYGEDAAEDPFVRECLARSSGAEDVLVAASIDGRFPEQLRSVADELDVLLLLRPGEAAWQAETAPLLRGIIDRGGTLLCDGPPAATALAGRWTPGGAPGMNLLPDSVLSTGAADGAAVRGTLLSVLALHPRGVGIAVEPGTALVLEGRKLRVLGEGKATALLMANERLPVRAQSIVAPLPGRHLPEDVLLDLTEWRRDAIDRTLPPFPPAHPLPPRLGKGTLIIVGGGAMPQGLMEQFIDMAGGKEHARLVFIPCEEAETLDATPATVSQWRQAGVEHATFLHTKNRHRANSDDAFLEPLRKATGIWFGGGRQWNFADSYYGTKAHCLMKAVLRRGGVIGGSSAGASVQARYLARATPIGNFRIMAPGYERGGLGFLSGVAIDQHFSQRQRQKDMTELMRHHPQLLGIGIDEGTALIVRQSTAEVTGAGQVYFYDRNRPVHPEKPDYEALGAGARYDLAQRHALPPPLPPASPPASHHEAP